MTSQSASIHELIFTMWLSEGLDTAYRAFRSGGASTYPTLFDSEAAPGTEFPYAVLQVEDPRIAWRTSGTPNHSYLIEDVPIRFSTYAKATPQKSAKSIASDLVEEILAVFGGHPTRKPSTFPDLDNVCFKIAQFIGDRGAKVGDEEYRWDVRYIFKIDVPVRIA